MSKIRNPGSMGRLSDTQPKNIDVGTSSMGRVPFQSPGSLELGRFHIFALYQKKNVTHVKKKNVTKM
jgi:hypothetical protein